MADYSKFCGYCGETYTAHDARQKYCSVRCRRKTEYDRNHIPVGGHYCRQCGAYFPIRPDQSNKWHCSDACARQSARESRSKFYAKNPRKEAEYRQKTKEKRLPEGNLVRFYRHNPDAPRACEACGENRILDVAHKPGHERRGAWRSTANCVWPEKVWILCPTCHMLLDRMHYQPGDIGLK